MDNRQVYHIFCDESRQTKDRYMVLGGTIMNNTDVPTFSSTMKKFRKENEMHAELKWSKVSEQRINEYKRFMEYFFALNNTDNIHFHCIIIDNHQVNYRKFSKGDYELGFYKFYYQLLLHCFGKLYCSNKNCARLIIHLDYRQSKYKLSALKTILNSGMNKKFGISYKPFVSIEPVNSKQSDLLQVSDIVLGAIGFQKNGYHLISSSRMAKIELANYISESAGLDNLISDTIRSNYRFTIWNFRLRK